MDIFLHLLDNLIAPLCVALICFICGMFYKNKIQYKKVRKTFNVKMIDEKLNLFYYKGFQDSSMTVLQDNSIEKTATFKIVIKNSSFTQGDEWIGYAIRSLPINDLRPLIKSNYSIKFNISHNGNLKSFYIELKSKTAEVIKKEIFLEKKCHDIEIILSEYVRDKNDWQDIYELCIVIMPHADWSGFISDELTIRGLRLEKH